MQTIRRAHPGWIVATVVAAAAVLLMTLWPDSTVNSANFVPFREHGAAWSCVLRQCRGAAESARFLIRDVIGNVVVFIPLGFALAGSLAGRSRFARFGLAVGGGALLSVFVETVQFQIATRATDVDDLIFNTIGTLFGAGALLVLERRTTD